MSVKPDAAVDPEIEQLPPDISRRASRLLGSLLRPHVPLAVILMISTVVGGIMSVAGPFFVARAIDDGLPAALDGNVRPLIFAISAVAAAGILDAAASWLSIRLNGKLSQKILFDLRGRLFRHVQRLDMRYHERSTSGRLVSRQTSDMESVQQFVSQALDQVVLALLTMSAIAVTLVVLNVPLALVAFAGFIPLVLLTIYARRKQRSAYRRTRTSIARVIVQFVETMGGIRAVQSFRRQRPGLQRLTGEDSEYAQANTDALNGVATFAGGTKLIGNLSQAGIILLGGWLVINGQTQLGVLAAFLLYLRRFYGPLDELVQSFTLYQSASAALEKITAVLDAEPDVQEPADPQPLPERRVGTGRSIAFDDVSFSYDAEEPEVLPAFDLEIPAGQIVAVVGATGAGKSTLVKLLTRMYDPTTGAVRLDGVDVRDLADARLRESLVMVTQESYLFSGTIADNIRIGNPDATDAQVLAAAEAVGLDPYVRSLPEGYDTDVKKRGGRLSSGQRQLVSFARVFLADPDVIVLDEATAHLDIPSERLIQQALARVLEGRTAIIIAHRLSTVEIADRVLVMDAGRVVEDGTPAELIHDDSRFGRMYSAWQDTLA
ncbi:ABC transporter ATP-binding protein [Brevibacterium luteolum]|uniref:ABC transporter ATP-binding protein n=1 Tax=Brevibacterium luteolum TaxID=199591 RepID=UPI00223BB31E|nr:ABC transporter ATP-binding protein [Brevibacterium luteolum]MCT1874554.1 ABC transporter ATP-binding protein/permease [Brevibacterium luteolum]MCT1891687.1 ABC transporter ATP-binding protein/permease [Brevibacterium luteolum]MCT1894250.1 ABC transporter ATP-binding protein/permease [Brevibacterium luteolum]MCT1924525.1 ABC transporter ATP-binding protein/permease [Brevibacterium luteolum]